MASPGAWINNYTSGKIWHLSSDENIFEVDSYNSFINRASYV